MGHAVQSGSVTVRSGGTQLTEDVSIGGGQFGFNGGAGARLSVTRNFGLRPEFRVYRYGGDDPLTFYRFAIGVYYQFGR
jgi:opacity protein-like surface antigen